MASNYRFKELIIMTAIEGIERQFNVKLEKSTLNNYLINSIYV